MSVRIELDYSIPREFTIPNLPEEFDRWQELFRSITKLVPNRLQLFWGYKFSLGLSFSIVAPAGMGKSLFGMVAAVYWARKGKKTYLILPTSTLVRQFSERLRSMGMAEREGLLVYLSGMKKEEKSRFFERFNSGKFKVLVTSSSFLVKHFSELSRFRFGFVFVDDIDAFLKASRNVERVLRLLNFDEEEIKSLSPNPKRRHGQLIVSTATAKPGLKAILFSRLLNFGVGRLRYSVREIEDIMLPCASEEEMFSSLQKIIKELGDGVLIFTPSQALAQELAAQLGDGFHAITSEMPMDKREALIKAFEHGQVQGLVGLANPYGLLVRGLDLPFRIRYVIFYHPPLIEMDKDGEKLTIGDVTSYIQASGRCSRLTPFGITKGYSFVLGLKEELDIFYRSCMIYDLEFQEVNSLNEIDFSKAAKEIEESRRPKRDGSLTDLIKPVLLVVESPTKARQIASFFGKPAFNLIGGQVFYETAVNDMVLITTASIGHVLDLEEDKGLYGVEVKEEKDGVIFRPLYGTIKRCLQDGFQFVSSDKCPLCGKKGFTDSGQRIRNIVSVGQFVDRVYLSSDPDREGEKISYDLSRFLPLDKVVRIELHEITKKALLKAVSNTRDVRVPLVMAQVCRRVEDRWIGFSLSAILRKVFKERHLSAGRAQSPVLHWVVDRTEKFFTRVEKFFISLSGLEIELESSDLPTGKVWVDVALVKEEDITLPPPPPFATDELLREANRILHIGAKECMRILQELFESGLITYHRTDSHTISDYGYNLARLYLGDDFKWRVWQKEASAHECIRPTRPLDVESLMEEVKSGRIVLPINLTRLHLRVYDLVFRRFMASLTAEALAHKKIYEIRLKDEAVIKELELIVSVSGKSYELYPWQVKVSSGLEEGRQEAEIYTKLVPLAWPFTQAELVGEMKAKGIGRPSTYAFIIDRLFLRGYVVEKKDRLYSTEKGKRIDRFLFSNYQEFVSEERTREMEERIDRVESEELQPGEVFYELYQEISRLVRK